MSDERPTSGTKRSRRAKLAWAGLAMGAIASGGIRLINEDVVREFGVTDAEIAAVSAAEERELER